MKIHTTWPHRWFGWWQRPGARWMHCPRAEDFIDTTWQWDPRLIQYLSDCPALWTTSLSAFPCVLGCAAMFGSISTRSDNTWHWLDDLGHYITVHRVRPPSSMIAHIEHANFTRPARLLVSPEQLDSP
jgi:hypothetical protein